MQSLEQFIASNRDLRKKFPQLHELWLQKKREQEMTEKTSNQTGNGTPVQEAVKLAQGLKADASAMTVPSPLPITVKPVDRRTIEGSTPGDFRAPANTRDLTEFAKNAPGPRDPARQSEVMSSKLRAAAAPVTVIGESEASQS